MFSSERIRRNNRAAQREIHIEVILNCFFTKQYQGKKAQCKNLKWKAQNLSKTDSISVICLASHPKDSRPTASALSVLIHRSFPIDMFILWSFLQLNFLFIGSYTTRGYVKPFQVTGTTSPYTELLERGYKTGHTVLHQQSSSYADV